MLFIGNDWAEAHHDVELVDEDGRRLARRRLPEGIEGLATLHALVADHLAEDADADQVVVGIETDRGPWVQALIAAGYTVYAINPLQVARYRERHGTSGAKSDPGDAHVLAELVRLDRAQRQANALRSMLREFYPAALAAFGDELTSSDALAILAIAPSPEAGRQLSRNRIAAALRRAGRQRNAATTAQRIQEALRAPQLTAHPGVVSAYTAAVRSLVAVITEMVTQTEVLRAEVEAGFGRHPDAEIYLSQPGLGTVLGARVLAEFGDDPHRYADPKTRKNYSGMAPITRASGTRRVVLARYARNRRLADALYHQAFTALTASPGARAYYDRQRARGATHHQALRALANRLVGILHGCLRHHTRYDEATAWHIGVDEVAAA